MALMLGLAGGVGLACLVHYLDNTVKTQAPEVVEALLAELIDARDREATATIMQRALGNGAT